MTPIDEPYKGVTLAREEMNPRGGCQCKLAALDLVDLITRALNGTAAFTGSAVTILGFPGDCAVVDTPATRLMCSTELTPVVGVNMFAAGRIAALHAMSDIYAAGGVPKWALVNLVLDAAHSLDVGEALLTGILSECARQETQVLGGQTIMASEAMAGLTIIGVPRTGHVLGKKGSRIGDALLLSKPLGVGLVQRAYKLGLLDQSALDAALAVMLTSNASASEAMSTVEVHAATDVTGFGLLGHLSEMLVPDLGAVIHLSAIPRILDVASVDQRVAQTVWIDDNYRYTASRLPLTGRTDRLDLAMLLDPQTNGGLLVTTHPDAASSLLGTFTTIGRITASKTIEIVD